MSFDLHIFAEALHIARAGRFLAFAWRHAKKLWALADSPGALGGVQRLTWDHPRFKVPDMIAAADAELARRAVEAALNQERHEQTI
jgi:hypothetical protein